MGKLLTWIDPGMQMKRNAINKPGKGEPAGHSNTVRLKPKSKRKASTPLTGNSLG